MESSRSRLSYIAPRSWSLFKFVRTMSKSESLSILSDLSVSVVSSFPDIGIVTFTVNDYLKLTFVEQLLFYPTAGHQM